jgi:alpha-beta hydrolase superfamily lysophospholipase
MTNTKYRSGADYPMGYWNFQVDFLFNRGYQVFVFDSRGVSRPGKQYSYNIYLYYY